MLLDRLQADLAMSQKARDQVKIDTLRFLLGAVLNFQIEKYPPASAKQMIDEEVMGIIAKQVKAHRESVEMFTQANRTDLVEKEKAEMAILSSYLPSQMSEDEVRSVVSKIKADNSGADFGTLMKLSMAELKGKADGALVVKLLK